MVGASMPFDCSSIYHHYVRNQPNMHPMVIVKRSFYPLAQRFGTSTVFTTSIFEAKMFIIFTNQQSPLTKLLRPVAIFKRSFHPVVQRFSKPQWTLLVGHDSDSCYSLIQCFMWGNFTNPKKSVRPYAGWIVRLMLNLYFYWSLVADVVVCINAKVGTTLHQT